MDNQQHDMPSNFCKRADYPAKSGSLFSSIMLKSIFLAGAITASSTVVASSTDYFGYFRAVSAWSEDGSMQEAFGLPGVSKYRLGNESDNYAELGVKHKFDMPAGYGDKEIEAVFMLADGTGPTELSNQFWDDTNFVQLYLKLDNFLGDGVDAWAGRRFYKRMDIHMNDYFWMNTGGNADGGFGIEGIQTAGGEFSFASFRFKDATNTGSNFDFRLEGIDTNEDGQLTLWLYAAMQHDSGADDAESGFGLGAWHTQSNVMGGSNTMALLYKSGAATNGTVVLGGAGYDDMSSFEFNNNLHIEPSENYSLQAAFIAKVDEASGGNVTWVSVGVRPVMYMTDHVSVAVELGLDTLDNEVTNLDGMLTKATVALQLSKGRGYYNRPVLRGFLTLANWDDDFQGAVGGTAYVNDTSGWTLGVQAEAWW